MASLGLGQRGGVRGRNEFELPSLVQLRIVMHADPADSDMQISSDYYIATICKRILRIFERDE
jgi:hypothetical protein